MSIRNSGYQPTSGSLDKALLVTKSRILMFPRKVKEFDLLYLDESVKGWHPRRRKMKLI